MAFFGVITENSPRWQMLSKLSVSGSPQVLCGALGVTLTDFKERTAVMDEKTRIELEAAAFRRLLQHLAERSDVQNIALMNLAGFCRNCLSKWYTAAAEERGIEMSYDMAREIVYGMPYDKWKAMHQKEATPEQQAAFDTAQKTQGH
jgi:hypothetical protein